MKRGDPFAIVGEAAVSDGELSPSVELPERDRGYEGKILSAYCRYAKEYRETVKRGRDSETENSIFPSFDYLNTRYKKTLKIGEGTFGEVFIVYDTEAQTYLTMKRMRRFLHSSRGKNVGLHSTTYREIQLLTVLRHPNITSIVRHHIIADGTVLLFFPVVAHDLSALLKGKKDSLGTAHAEPLRLPVVKCIFLQLLEAVSHIHTHKIIHRDIKTSNIMVDHNGVVSLIDFGWARYQRLKGQMTLNPCNILYRAPELIASPYHSSHYDFSLDIWCCGCVLFELLTGRRFITADNEVNTLRCIQDWLGAPSPSCTLYYQRDALFRFDRTKTNQFHQRCRPYQLGEAETQFLELLLQWDPSERPFAKQLLAHSWFDTAPRPCLPSEIPLPAHNSYRWLQKHGGYS